MSRQHTITLIIWDDGRVEGDLDDTLPLWPIDTESTAESTMLIRLPPTTA